MAAHTEADRKSGRETPPPSRYSERPRLWPAALLIGVYWAVRIGGRIGFLGSLVGPWRAPVEVLVALGLLAWWLFFSNLRRVESVVGLLVLVVAGAAAIPSVHVSLNTLHRDGVVALAAPFVVTAIFAWLVVSYRASPKLRDAGLVGVVLAAWGGLMLVKVADASTDLQWRWSPTAEQKFLEQRAGGAKARVTPIGSLVVGPEDWPQFRGPHRDNRLTDARIETDWDKHPPKLLWKQRIGPGWSSFAVVGDFGFTQEQRGDHEATVCYRVDSGNEAWAHVDTARFYSPLTGAGPRATPTFHDGRLYAMGATGLLNCLDAATGRLIWQRDIKQDADAKLPDWGYAASPLVVGDKVVAFAGGGNGKATVAYRADDGALAWLGGTGGHSFSSPQPAQIEGVEQVLMAHDLGLDALAPGDGKTLWHYDWNMNGNARIVQPHALGDGRVVLASGYGEGSRLLKVSHQDDAWQAEAVWTSKKLVPYYNDFVVYDDHAYGFDGNIFCCTDLQTGQRKWKKGRYGNGQVLLLAEQGMLLVLSDQGEAVLVAAEPDDLREVSRCKVLDGKTWNHPVLVRGKLLVRNAEEAACYELTLQ